ncbi:conserved hypothetical protein [Haloferula helveola]|uniref:Uncharacterized protein n=1 Tax=Haloferula helveola TaxID=490095 RepID=A0ABM7RN98_9BACT|nr:conserved hypothetical protein [Haloferula helveola]
MPPQRLLIAACVVLASCSTVSEQTSEEAPTEGSSGDRSHQYTTYVNPRFGFRLSYPASLHASPEPTNGAGRTFTSSDGDFSVSAQAHFLQNGDDLDSLWNDARRDAGSSVNYSLKRPTFFVISGSDAGREYYRKVFTRGGNWVRFDILYPSSKRSLYDPVVERIERDFVPFLPGDYDRAP